MKYAIVQLGGKQFKIEEGDTITVERQSMPLNISTLVYNDGKDIKVGEPYLSDITVKMTLIEDFRDDKVRVARFKSKSRYRKEKSHRQPMSRLKVVSINEKGANSQETEDIKVEETKKAAKVKKTAKPKKVAKTVKKVSSKKK